MEPPPGAGGVPAVNETTDRPDSLGWATERIARRGCMGWEKDAAWGSVPRAAKDAASEWDLAG